EDGEAVDPGEHDGSRYTCSRRSGMLEHLTTCASVVIYSNMRRAKADLLHRGRHALSETAFVEIVIWQVPQPVPGSVHSFKYRLALVSDDICVLRYDNERGKGDHKHVNEREVPYRFTDLETLQADFWKDVERWSKKL